MSIKIAFCTDGIFPHKVGGMQRHSKLLVEALVKYKDLEITVFHPHSQKVFDTYSNLKEVSVEEIDVNKNYLKECKAYSKRIYQQLINNNFDVIYSQGLSVWYKAKVFKDKLIVNPHGLEPYQAIGIKEKLVSIAFKKVFNSIFKEAKYVVSLGGKLTEILTKYTAKHKIVLLPNATNLPIHLDDNRNNTQILQFLFVSRFAKNKGIHILMDVINQLNAKGYSKNFFFHLAGKGPLFKKYSTQYAYSNVKYWGFISDEDLKQLYQTVDVFVFPTLFEGMPTVVLEAMSYQLPVIVTDVGATAELVDESNGFLIERNQPKQLMDAILKFSNLSNSHKQKLGKVSYQKVKDNFTWQAVAQKHYNLFKQIK